MTTLRIGQYESLGTQPAYYHLLRELRQDHWQFVPAIPTDLDRALEHDEVDISLVSPLLLCTAPDDYLVLPGVGYGARRHTRNMFLFSDMLLDDIDEMTISIPGEITSATILQIVTGRYLQFQNEFIVGWGSAEAFLLVGDPALRERQLGRYAYVYDIGDLWRHYTGKHMVYGLWALKRETFRRRREEVLDFHRSLRRGIALMTGDWAVAAAQLRGYEWLRNPQTILQLWADLDFELTEEHLVGLQRYFTDCVESGIIEEPPEIAYAEV